MHKQIRMNKSNQSSVIQFGSHSVNQREEPIPILWNTYFLLTHLNLLLHFFPYTVKYKHFVWGLKSWKLQGIQGQPQQARCTWLHIPSIFPSPNGTNKIRGVCKERKSFTYKYECFFFLFFVWFLFWDGYPVLREMSF